MDLLFQALPSSSRYFWVDMETCQFYLLISLTVIILILMRPSGFSLNENIRTQFESHYPYEGCLADLDVTYGPNSEFVGTPPNFEIRHTSPPINPLHYSQMSPDILPGCSPLDTSLGGKEMAQTRCRPGNCGYGGRCIQQLSSTFCDCSLSGFAGHDCTDRMSVILKRPRGKKPEVLILPFCRSQCHINIYKCDAIKTVHGYKTLHDRSGE